MVKVLIVLIIVRSKYKTLGKVGRKIPQAGSNPALTAKYYKHLKQIVMESDKYDKQNPS